MNSATNYRKEVPATGIGSPYRQAIYMMARKMGYTIDAAIKAAKECDPKVVRRFERGG